MASTSVDGPSGPGDASFIDSLRGRDASHVYKVLIGELNKLKSCVDFVNGQFVLRTGGASNIVFDPTGLTYITATNVQDALEQLDSAISAITTGDIIIPAVGALKNRIIYNETTDNTPTELFVDGDGSTRLTITDDTSWTFGIHITVHRTDSPGESAGYKYEGVIDRQSGVGTTALVGTVSETILAEDSAPWSISVTADNVNGSLKVEVTGENLKTIRWLGRVEISEVFN